jgi:hypothetical protein
MLRTPLRPRALHRRCSRTHPSMSFTRILPAIVLSLVVAAMPALASPRI